MSDKLTRRSLLVGGAALAAASCLPDVDGQWQDEGLALCSSSEPKVTPGDPAQAGRVLEVKDSTLCDAEGNISEAAVAAAWQRLLLAVTGSPDVMAAWAKLMPKRTDGQIIGLKVNTLNPQVPTRPELVKAVIESLKSAGVPAEQILVWDRRKDELTKAGLTSEALGVPVEGTFDTAKDKGSGRGYDITKVTCLGGRKSSLSNILTRRIDLLVNLAVMKRHDASGFTGCLKNHYGSIDNPGDFHDKLGTGGVLLERRFDKAIPAINALPEVAGKTCLWVIDSILGVAEGGTESPADCVPNRLLAGLDPVALDVRARQVRDEMRVQKGLAADDETISEPWVQACARAGLGVTDIKLEPVT